MTDGQHIVAQLAKLLNQADTAQATICGSEEDPGNEFTVTWWTHDLHHTTYLLRREGGTWNGIPLNRPRPHEHDGGKQ